VSIELPDNDAPLVVVSDNVLEQDADGILGEAISRAFRPFHDHDCATVDYFIPAQIREIGWILDPVEV
jgi:hypothetical protein